MFRYEKLRSVREVLTEGVNDAVAINAELLDLGNQTITAIAVDFIEVDLEDYDRSLESNNKAKLIYIARKLDEIPSITERIVCLVDADTNAFAGVSPFHSLVICTDYADLGMHFVSQEAVGEIARLNFHAPDEDAASLIDLATIAAMHELAARTIMETRAHKRAIPSTANFFNKARGLTVFDKSAFDSALRSVAIDPAAVDLLVSGAISGPLERACYTNSHDVCDALLKLFRNISGRAARLRREDLEDRFFLLRRFSNLGKSLALRAILRRLSQ